MDTNSEQINNLTQLNEDLENYFSNTIIPQLFVDANLILRKFTPPAMKQFSLKENFIGKPLDEIKENFRFPTIIDNIKTVIATGKILEKEIQTTDMRWFQMNVLPYIVRKENITNGVIITFVDITARIQDLKEQERLLAEHELLLDTIAHDIKNPLLALSLSVQMMKNLPSRSIEEFSRLTVNLEKSLTSMKGVVESMLDSRWQKQRYHAMEELLDIGSILEDVRLAIAPLVIESGAEIISDLKIMEITFVRRKLRSVIYNLLNNAMKYTSKDVKPIIKISSEKIDDFVVISVQDNGVGISEQAMEHIFSKFKRIKSDVEGSGVGLYLVHTIINTSGGKIEINSKEGEGSVFKMYIKQTNEAN
ncbi:ATP-binding protein [Pedobacter aquatilis]|uniref:sensor histidine kinase n=1 Tax=Pedobacter aquatilis TaxID=351343 RepID=UPI0025B58409|nr:ATP-binding protein [Pedobacter aquatilis]MDN3587550.1 ATP-binding protein [Pedobacter aquatilis]